MRICFRALLCGAFLLSGVLWAEEPALKSQPAAVEIEALWQEGRKADAEKRLAKWLKAEKTSPWPLVQSAVLLYREKRYKKSNAVLSDALERSPNCAEAYFWRGKNYEALNKPMEAANEYRAALMAEEKFYDAQEALNRVLTLLGSST